MTGPRDLPPQMISLSDQAYAEASEHLDALIEVMRHGMDTHPEWNHNVSVLWTRTAFDYHETLDEVDCQRMERMIHEHTANIMIAAVCRLAFQERDPLEGLDNA